MQYQAFLDISNTLGCSSKGDVFKTSLYDNSGYRLYCEVVYKDGRRANYDVANIVDSIGELVVSALSFNFGSLFLDTYKVGFGDRKNEKVIYQVLDVVKTDDVYKLICEPFTITLYLSNKSLKKPSDHKFLEVVSKGDSVSELVNDKGVKYYRILPSNLKVFKNGELIHLDELIYLADDSIVIDDVVYKLDNVSLAGYGYDEVRFNFGEYSVLVNGLGYREYLYWRFR